MAGIEKRKWNNMGIAELNHTYSNQMYLYHVLANSAAPVFGGIKPSCLVTIWKHRVENLNHYLEEQTFSRKYNCEFKILLETDLYYLLFCYHKDLLDDTLRQTKRSLIMSPYCMEENMDSCIQILMTNMKKNYMDKCIFPHEIGVFLGYPLWDVEGFIMNHGQNYIMVGYWKVYDDIRGAIHKFQEYDRLKIQAVYTLQQFYERNNHKK